jgi:hypothetical protein
MESLNTLLKNEVSKQHIAGKKFSSTIKENRNTTGKTRVHMQKTNRMRTTCAASGEGAEQRARRTFDAAAAACFALLFRAAEAISAAATIEPCCLAM